MANSGAASNITPGTIFCTGCGGAVVHSAAFCPNCGTPRIAGATTSSPQPPTPFSGAPVGAPPAYSQAVLVNEPRLKSKTTSILLAVFLSSYTWLYTYRADSWKFWTAIGLGVVSVILTLTVGFGFLIGLGVGIWAIIDVSLKPQSFYQQYWITYGRRQ